MKDVLLLFDIDGTLIRFSGRTRIIHERFSFVVNKTFNAHTSIDLIDDNGKTLRAILLELCKQAGVKKADAVKHLPQMYALEEKYVKERSKLYHNRPIKGAKALLKRLKKAGYPMGLLTGNSEFMSWFKMKKTGLEGFFNFGAFGNVSEHRERLVTAAIKTANKKFKKRFLPQNVFYFGDAPLDIIAGRKAGVKVIAVATGSLSVSELRRNKPDYVLRDLSDSGKIIKIIRNV